MEYLPYSPLAPIAHEGCCNDGNSPLRRFHRRSSSYEISSYKDDLPCKNLFHRDNQ